MRKCHYIHDKIAGKVLIPGCWGTAITGRIDSCHCKRTPETFEQFEKKEFKQKLQEKEQYIKELEKEVSQLNRIIKRLTLPIKQGNK